MHALQGLTGKCLDPATLFVGRRRKHDHPGYVFNRRIPRLAESKVVFGSFSGRAEHHDKSGFLSESLQPMS